LVSLAGEAASIALEALRLRAVQARVIGRVLPQQSPLIQIV